MKFTHPSVSLSLCLLACLLLQGCAQDAPSLQQARDAASATLAQAQSDRDRIDRELAALPADDPVRKALQPQLDRLDQFITKAQSYLPLLDAAVKTASAQPLDPALQQALAAVPYGSLAIAALGVIFGVVKHLQAGSLLNQHQQSQNAFAQLVTALDAVLPAPTPDQQTKLNAALDSDVKAKLAAARV